MKVERNIDFLEGNKLPYYVRVTRNRQTIRETYDTLKEAIFARDEIEENYHTTGKMKHSSIYEQGRLKLAKRRYQRDDLKKIINVSGQSVYTIDAVCKQCDRRLTYRLQKFYQQFLDRGQKCQSCFAKENFDSFIDARNANDKPYSTNRSTGIKNISFDKSSYHVKVIRKNQKISKYAHTLNEAIAIKEHILDFYEKHDRLPTHDEI